MRMERVTHIARTVDDELKDQDHTDAIEWKSIPTTECYFFQSTRQMCKELGNYKSGDYPRFVRALTFCSKKQEKHDVAAKKTIVHITFKSQRRRSYQKLDW